MRIQVRTVEYKEYYIEGEARFISDDDITYHIKNHIYNEKPSNTSKEIIMDVTILPDNQEDYDYLKDKDVYIEKVYKEDDLDRELNSVYESGLGLEQGKVQF